MGWCSATEIFDVVVGEILHPGLDKEGIIKLLIETLENNDWDCHQDSVYYDNPIVQKILKELHPRWFEEE